MEVQAGILSVLQEEWEEYNACFVNADTGIFIGSSNDLIYKTYDGGNTWE